MKSGYLYVLTHPSNPNLYKVGHTTGDPLKQLAKHNTGREKYTGKIVKETGQEWKMKTYIEVPDPAWAKTVFWGSTPLADIPYLGGIEVQEMKLEWIEAGLNAAKKAGLRPSMQEQPDYVYAYTSWMKNRLEGRDVILLGYVRSRGGKATFRCNNGHQWRANPIHVATGEGCAVCGAGKRSIEEMTNVINSAYLCLLTHPDKPGFIKIVLTSNSLEKCFEVVPHDGWIIHRYRDVEENPILAEKLIWEILNLSKPNNSQEIEVDHSLAEQAFRDLIYRVRYHVALAEKANEKRFNEGKILD